MGRCQGASKHVGQAMLSKLRVERSCLGDWRWEGELAGLLLYSQSRDAEVKGKYKKWRSSSIGQNLKRRESKEFGVILKLVILKLITERVVVFLEDDKLGPVEERTTFLSLELSW